MEANSTTINKIAAPNASSQRWEILRRALLRRHSPPSDKQSEKGLNLVSRKATHGFNLIPYHIIDDQSEEISDAFTRNTGLGSSRDSCFRYTLPIHDSPNILLFQRVDDGADLSDFEVCNRHNIDNTGLVCKSSMNIST